MSEISKLRRTERIKELEESRLLAWRSNELLANTLLETVREKRKLEEALLTLKELYEDHLDDTMMSIIDEALEGTGKHDDGGEVQA
jgi:hypothetical protein